MRAEPDDPGRDDVARLVATHVRWSGNQTPAEFSFALDGAGLAAPDMTLFSVRDEAGVLLGIAALRELDPSHGEIKSMHTAVTARGRGVARTLLDGVLTEARARGYRRVSLETGTGDTFAAARALYRSAGFRAGPPFAGYENTEHNHCMTLPLDAAPS